MGREYTAEFHNKEEKLIHQTSRNRYKLHEFWYYACIMSLDRRWGGKSMAWTLSYLRVSTLVFGIGASELVSGMGVDRGCRHVCGCMNA
jgi:hypothetical protein